MPFEGCTERPGLHPEHGATRGRRSRRPDTDVSMEGAGGRGFEMSCPVHHAARTRGGAHIEKDAATREIDRNAGNAGEEGGDGARDNGIAGGVGQSFADAKYFHGRPSATTDTDPNDSTKTVPAPYNAANSGGSNLGPSNKALIDRVQGDMDKLKQENPSTPVPADLVTTSASGLDPHISPEAALFQVPRIAKARNMPEDRIRQLVADHTEGRLFGLFGEPRVNVLLLNLALDQMAG